MTTSQQNVGSTFASDDVRLRVRTVMRERIVARVRVRALVKGLGGTVQTECKKRTQ